MKLWEFVKIIVKFNGIKFVNIVIDFDFVSCLREFIEGVNKFLEKVEMFNLMDC